MVTTSVKPAGMGGRHVYMAEHSESAQSMAPSLSSSVPLVQSSTFGIVPLELPEPLVIPDEPAPDDEVVPGSHKANS